MAKKTYKKGPTGVSFAGTFVWPKVSEVDYGSDDYPKKDGEFSINLKGRLDDPKVKAFIAQLQPLHDAAVAKAKEKFKGLKPQDRKKLEKVTVQPLYKELYEEDGETPTGEVSFKFGMRYSGDYKSGKREGEKWYRVPQIFDAAGKNLKYWNTYRDGREPKRNLNAPDIWGGTVGRVAYEVGIDADGDAGYFIPATGVAGIALKLEAARILDLVTAGERSADSYGFDAEEEGSFTYSNEDAGAPADEDPTDTPADKSGETAKEDDDTDF